MRISWRRFSLLIVMSLVGLWSSGMVLVLFYTVRTELPACRLNQGEIGGVAINCDRVLQSSFNSVLGVPLDVLAAVYFAANMLLLYLVSFGSDWVSATSLRFLFAWRFFGIAIVPYLIFVEFFILRAICIYCTVMHGAIIVDFVIISYFLFYRKSVKTFIAESPQRF